MRLIAAIEKPISFEVQLCKVSASSGTVLSVNYARPVIDRMMDDADIALYSAKREGRGCHVAYSPALRLESNTSVPIDAARRAL